MSTENPLLNMFGAAMYRDPGAPDKNGIFRKPTFSEAFWNSELAGQVLAMNMARQQQMTDPLYQAKVHDINAQHVADQELASGLANPRNAMLGNPMQINTAKQFNPSIDTDSIDGSVFRNAIGDAINDNYVQGLTKNFGAAPVRRLKGLAAESELGRQINLESLKYETAPQYANQARMITADDEKQKVQNELYKRKALAEQARDAGSLLPYLAGIGNFNAEAEDKSKQVIADTNAGLFGKRSTLAGSLLDKEQYDADLARKYRPVTTTLYNLNRGNELAKAIQGIPDLSGFYQTRPSLALTPGGFKYSESSSKIPTQLDMLTGNQGVVNPTSGISNNLIGIGGGLNLVPKTVTEYDNEGQPLPSRAPLPPLARPTVASSPVDLQTLKNLGLEETIPSASSYEEAIANAGGRVMPDGSIKPILEQRTVQRPTSLRFPELAPVSNTAIAVKHTPDELMAMKQKWDRIKDFYKKEQLKPNSVYRQAIR